jgi:hypothetical protein
VKKWVRQFLETLRVIPRTEIVARVSPDYPDQKALVPGLLHVVGGNGYRKWAYFKCPCGCGAPIMLSLSTTRRPSWQVEIDWLDRPTIEPSVWQTDGCHSHFWVEQGRITWVKDTGRAPPASYFTA